MKKHILNECSKDFYPFFLFNLAKVRAFITCRECGKRRVVYSSAKLPPAELRSIGRVEEELIYICGDPLFHAGRYHDTILVKEGIGCNSEIEAAYYAGCCSIFLAINSLTIVKNETLVLKMSSCKFIFVSVVE